MREIDRLTRPIEDLNPAPRPDLIRPEIIRFNLPAQLPMEAQRVRRAMRRIPQDGRR